MKRLFAVFCLAILAAITIDCGGSSSSSSGTATSSNVFITGEDAPVSTVVGFNITIDNITLNNASTSVTALSTPTAVDFGRLMGLRSLLGFNTIPAGTFSSATFTFEASNPVPVINYVDFSTNPPTVKQLTGTLTQTTVTVPFPAGRPLMVNSNGLAGLHIDFDLRDSLVTDNSGQVTGTINPMLSVMAVSASDELGEITDFTGNVVSVNVGGNSFLVQGSYGFQETIEVNAHTLYNGSNSLSTLVPNAIVSVIGKVQEDGSILAAGVDLISTDEAFVSGRILAVDPVSGPVQTVTMWVGEEIGTSWIIPVQSIDLRAVTDYDICFFDNLLTGRVFNNASLVVGQRIFIGGSTAGGVFTPQTVSLRRQGVVGSLVAGSVTVTGGSGSNLGYFQMQNDALMSYAAGGPFTVYTADATTFENINGLAGLQTAGTPNLIARGLVFKDPTSGKPVVVAGRVRVLPAAQ